MAKLVVMIASIILCLSSNSLLTGAFTVLFFCIVTVRKSGIRLADFLRMLRAPSLFLLMGTVPVVFARFDNWESVLFGLQVREWVYGVSAASLISGVRLAARALGCAASVYFAVLSTPITDMMFAFKRLHIPQLFLELMELIYRFIFVLYEAVQRIHTAQASRLGYYGFRQSYRSLGVLISMVFIKACRKSDTIYISLEARGYQGDFCTLSPCYQSGVALYLMGAGLTIMQLALTVAERSWMHL